MNIQTTSQSVGRMTAAETALVEAFGAQFGGLPGDGVVAGKRDRLLDDLKKAGLPTRRIESWHYTDLRTLLRSIPDAAPAAAVNPIAPLVEGSAILSVLQGEADEKASVDGIDVALFKDRLVDGSAAGGLTALDRDDAIGRINGSFVRDGFAISVPANAELEEPIELQALHSGGQIHTRFPVSFGAASKATIIERHQAVGEGAALVSSVSDIVLEERKSHGSSCSSRVATTRISGRSA